MSITIDSMIWIYNYNYAYSESKNVKGWLRGEKGALHTYDNIVLSTIIPLEIICMRKKQ